MTFPECSTQRSLQFIIGRGEKKGFVTKMFYCIVIKRLILTPKKSCISVTEEEGGGRLGDESPSPFISFYHSVTPPVIVGDVFPHK